MTYLIVVLIGVGLILAFRLLTWPATFVATLMALPLLWAGGWSWLTAPLAFLISSSVWTRWPGASRERDRTRHARQVLANGLPGMVFAAVALVLSDPRFGVAVAASFAAAAADTWATEWGGSFGGRPLSLRTFRTVPPGQSGAISLVGTLATVAGAAFIAVLCAATGMILWKYALWVTLAGTAGSLLDSLAGAWVQGLWNGPTGELHETPPAGKKSRLLRGLRWVDNDIVNLIATTSGGLIVLWSLGL